MIEQVYQNSGLLGVAVALALMAGFRWFNQQTIQQMNHAAAEDQRDTLVTEAFVRLTERGQVDSEVTQKLAYTLSVELIGLKGLLEQGFKDMRGDVAALKIIVLDSVKGDKSS